MNHKMIISTLGKILIAEAIMMILPLIVCIIYKENCYLAFIIPMALLVVLGIMCNLSKPTRKTFYAKDGFIIVGLSWIMMSLFGSLPFVISGQISSFIDAFFETVSGFSTTGASVVTNIDDWYNGAKSLLFWRSFTHWIGGMGVLVFILAILPQSEGQNIFILKAESTGPKVGKLVSKVKVTARILYLIYFGMTILEIVLLALDPSMPVFDAIVHGIGTAGTGGFGIKGDSVGSYSNYIQIVIAIFMFLFGINFNIFYLIIIGRFKQALKSEEMWIYISLVLTSTMLICINVYNCASLAYVSLGDALRNSFFQVSSIITTTGFSTVDFNMWPAFSQTILFVLMFIGGCAGSTAGGMKVSRFAIILKSLRREIQKLVHPKSVSNIKFEGSKLEDGVVKGVLGYFGLLTIIFGICFIIISIDGFDFTTNFTAVTACLNNIGPGLGNIVGPAGSFVSFSWYSKLTLIMAMLIGRLEIYPILVLFNPKVWLNK